MTAESPFSKMTLDARLSHSFYLLFRTAILSNVKIHRHYCNKIVNVENVEKDVEIFKNALVEVAPN